MPVILIISQSISQKLLQPPKKPGELDEAAAASQQIVQYLPILIGVFALNVPSGLAVYWVTNNLVSTVATLTVKANVAKEMEGLQLAGWVPCVGIVCTCGGGGGGTPHHTRLP